MIKINSLFLLGYLVWEFKKEQLFSPSQPILLKESTNWKLYRNKKYNFELKYSQKGGSLEIELPENQTKRWLKDILTQQIQSGVFSLIPENSEIVKIGYHSRPKTFAFIRKSKK